MSVILEVKDLHVRYGKVEALHGANLKVGAGQIVTVIGPNGAGKSTLIMNLSGELEPLAGRLTRGEKTVVGYFAQHQLDSLDSKASPLLHLQRLAPTEREQTLRDFLGGFDLTPTFRDVNKKFSTRYYLSLVLIDEDARRYFKQSEIVLFRQAPENSALAMQQAKEIQAS